MKGIITAILDTSKDRLKNPFIGAFAISWIAINWKPIVTFLFSSKTVEKRIELIELNYESTWNILFLPLIIAGIYIIVLPYLMLIFDLISNNALKKKKKKNLFEHRFYDIQGRKKLAIGESELEDIKANYREKSDLNRKIEQLNNNIEKKNKLIENLQSKVETLNKDYENLKRFSTDSMNLSFTLEEERELNEEYAKFRKEDYSEYFTEVGSEVSQNNSIPSKIDKIIIEKYLYADIIKKIIDKEEQSINYVFTESIQNFVFLKNNFKIHRFKII
ncbi:hypothetical protein SAMN04487911_13138 [Arenibacter nanhaiticus]|uniref:Uncharacterized protein n=1 Tax=Arenibacter nanhaiticus TaxID=558155 RepID=A0A1M6LHD4_9FLAO|nr:hypothetical protein [Arenibacter nanhaiticus]SHJ70593.1 hypothetical protein SAMN04487911_13138 [Arenibacter nanhaiticus]